MKNIFKISLLFFILAGNYSCKKETPTPDSTPPVFYFRGNIGNNGINLQAGVNNYYMYSSFNQNSNTDVYSFNGDLSTYNCTSCGNAIDITLNDFQPSSINGNADINTSLSSGYYPFQTPNGTATNFAVQFQSYEHNGNALSEQWDFGDNVTYTGHNPLHTYVRPGKYRVFHSVTFSSSAIDTSSYNIYLGIPEAECQGAFGQYATGTTVTFGPSLGGTAPYYYFWDFGDGNYSTSATPAHTYANSGAYRVYMRVTDSNAGVLERVENVYTQNYTGRCSYFITSFTPTANPLLLSNVTVNWTDAAGNHYTSNHGSQPTSSYCKLVSVEDYANNSSGQTTKKLHLNFKCEVYNTATNDSLLIDNGDAVIAVAYR